MRVIVAAWAGSRNLGDELLLEVTVGLLRDRGAEPVVISVDPGSTATEFDVEAVHHMNLPGLRRAFRSADAMVFGGGGLLQDESSRWNLPYHLSRIERADHRGMPWVGIGLGAAGITTDRGRSQVREAFTDHRVAVVRDDASFTALADLGIERLTLGADLAWLLPRPDVSQQDTVTVTLRLPQSTSWLPGALARPARRDAEWVRAMARALDNAHRSTSYVTQFVAFERGSDDVLHRQVAAHMETPYELLAPTRTELLPLMTAARACISMRYHGMITAAMGSVPGVSMTFSPKLAAIAGDLGMPAIEPSPAAIRRLPELLEISKPAGIAANVARLTDRAAANADAIDLLLQP